MLGKVAAQCAHAACGAVEVAAKRKPEILKNWRMEGQAKVLSNIVAAVKGVSEKLYFYSTALYMLKLA